MILKSMGTCLVLRRGSFRGNDGSEVPSVMLYDPDSRQTFSLYGSRVASVIPADLDPMEEVTLTIEWSHSKRGWTPHLVSCSS